MSRWASVLGSRAGFVFAPPSGLPVEASHRPWSASGVTESVAAGPRLASRALGFAARGWRCRPRAGFGLALALGVGCGSIGSRRAWRAGVGHGEGRRERASRRRCVLRALGFGDVVWRCCVGSTFALALASLHSVSLVLWFLFVLSAHAASSRLCVWSSRSLSRTADWRFTRDRHPFCCYGSWGVGLALPAAVSVRERR